MSSPPHQPNPLSIPKRPTFNTTPTSVVTAARRTSSLHPLRQTSFPVEDHDGMRVFSATSARSETGSIGAGSLKSVGFGKSPGSGTGRGRGRPRKDKSKGTEADKASVASTGTASGLGAGGAGEKRKRGATPGSKVGPDGEGGDEEDDNEADGAGGEIMRSGNVAREMEAKNMKSDNTANEQNVQHVLFHLSFLGGLFRLWVQGLTTMRSVLMQSLDPDQLDRYSMMKRVKLKKETVRKTTNQTLSQSVPPSIISNVSGFTKVFIGEIIELAREVQVEYAKAWTLQNPPASPPANNPLHPSSTQPISGFSAPTTNPYISPPPQPNSHIPRRGNYVLSGNPHEGPLLPDHVREALRRYKKNGEGGGVGAVGLSLGAMGVKGDVSWRVGGRRLFR